MHCLELGVDVTLKYNEKRSEKMRLGMNSLFYYVLGIEWVTLLL